MQPLPSSQPIDVHSTVPAGQLSRPVHSTAHEQDVPHVTPRHDCWPEHCTSHGPLPHVTLRHVPWPEHSTVHDVAPTQLTPLRHELVASHLTSQL